MNYCNNCGKKLSENANYCGECGNKIVGDSHLNDNNIQKLEDDGNWKYYLLANGGLILLSFFLPSGKNYMYTAALIVLVTAKVKYPKNKVVSVIFWIEILGSILLLVLFIFLLVTCISTCSSLG